MKQGNCDIQLVNNCYVYQIAFFTSNQDYQTIYKLCCKHTQFKFAGQVIAIGNDVTTILDKKLNFTQNRERQLLDKLVNNIANNNYTFQLECFINNNKKLYEKRIDILNYIFDVLQYPKTHWKCDFSKQQPQIQLVIDCEIRTQRWIFGYCPVPCPVDFNVPLTGIKPYSQCPVMRRFLQQYTLKQRPVIGPTSMDNEISFMMTNIAQVTQNSIVYDPFCGTCSILISCAACGAKIIGSDFDAKILNKKHRENFKFYDLQTPTLINANVFQTPIKSGTITHIITDPPYAVRAAQIDQNGDGGLKLSEILLMLYKVAIKSLICGGMLVFWLPVPTEYQFGIDDLPVSDVLIVEAFKMQYLNSKYSRRLVVAQKVKDVTFEDVYFKKDVHCFENVRALLGGSHPSGHHNRGSSKSSKK